MVEQQRRTRRGRPATSPAASGEPLTVGDGGGEVLSDAPTDGFAHAITDVWSDTLADALADAPADTRSGATAGVHSNAAADAFFFPLTGA